MHFAIQVACVSLYFSIGSKLETKSKTTNLLTLKHFLKPIRNILGNATDTEDAMCVKVVKVASRGALTYWAVFSILLISFQYRTAWQSFGYSVESHPLTNDINCLFS